MNSALRDRVARVTGARPVAWERRGGGWAANDRWSVELDDGRRVFVKHGAAEILAEFLRNEHRFYVEVQAPFMPQLVGFDDDGEYPLLVLEDLAHGTWPPPWTDDEIDAVRATLREVRATPPPPHLPRPAERIETLRVGWDEVARDPQPFLSLGLVDRDWLDAALPPLLEASHAARIDGDELIHFDVRSDNICFARGRAILVDWNLAARGNGDFDVACWLPSLATEGGPQPWDVLPAAPEYAALLAGFFASRAGLPPPSTAPLVRTVQLRQLVPALAWARREVGV
jgi:hypothetical protein